MPEHPESTWNHSSWTRITPHRKGFVKLPIATRRISEGLVMRVRKRYTFLSEYVLPIPRSRFGLW